MNSSCVGWMCGGTPVPAGSSDSHANISALCAFEWYMCPSTFQTCPSYASSARVMPLASSPSTMSSLLIG